MKWKDWKKKFEKNKDELLDRLLGGEFKTSKLSIDLEYETHNALHDIALLESKSIKLEISPAQIDRIKNSVLSS